jgi:hypothetical protein
MQEQENKEKVLQLINIYAVNKYLEKMLVSKTKKLTLSREGKNSDIIMLEELSNLISLETSKN